MSRANIDKRLRQWWLGGLAPRHQNFGHFYHHIQSWEWVIYEYLAQKIMCAQQEGSQWLQCKIIYHIINKVKNKLPVLAADDEQWYSQYHDNVSSGITNSLTSQYQWARRRAGLVGWAACWTGRSGAGTHTLEVVAAMASWTCNIICYSWTTTKMTRAAYGWILVIILRN